MPAKNHGHGPFPQWTSDDRFCLFTTLHLQCWNLRLKIGSRLWHQCHHHS